MKYAVYRAGTWLLTVAAYLWQFQRPNLALTAWLVGAILAAGQSVSLVQEGEGGNWEPMPLGQISLLLCHALVLASWLTLVLALGVHLANLDPPPLWPVAILPVMAGLLWLVKSQRERRKVLW